MQGPTCDKKKIDLKQLLESSSSESEETGKSEGITEDEMKEAQNQLSKLMSPEQTQHAMTILRGIRVGATEQEKQSTVVSFKMHASSFLHHHRHLIHVFWFICSLI